MPWKQRGRLALLSAAVCCLVGCGKAPQLGSEEALHAADSLWTAVTSRRTELLHQVAADCDRLQQTGHLTQPAHSALQAIVRRAEAGEWEGAAADLKAFIQEQRRPE